MDWADDVAYSVHDIEDFYRAGFIPLDRLVGATSPERNAFLQSALERRRREGINSAHSDDELADAFTELINTFPFSSPYRGERRQRVLLRSQAAYLINDYVGAIRLAHRSANGGKRVTIDEHVEREVIMCKELTWHYVINHPTVVMQRGGQETVIRALFERLLDAAEPATGYVMFPEGYKERLREAHSTHDRVQIVVDFIASMTEPQAIESYQRLTGGSLGSLWDPISL